MGNLASIPNAKSQPFTTTASGGEGLPVTGVTVTTYPARVESTEPESNVEVALARNVGAIRPEITLNAEDGDQPFCRICFEGVVPLPGMESLLSPCHCRGSQQHVHPLCLRKWQISIVLGATAHPSRSHKEHRHTMCNICEGTFSTLPPSREDILRCSVGESLCCMLKPGNLLVHRSMADLPESFNRLPPGIMSLMELKRQHWKDSVYLITSIYRLPAEHDGSLQQRFSTDMCVTAINLTRNMAEEGLEPPGGAREHGMNSSSAVSLAFFNGGPVMWSRERQAIIVPPATAAPQAADTATPEHLTLLTMGDGSSLLLGNVTAAVRQMDTYHSATKNGSGSDQEGMPHPASPSDEVRVYCGRAEWGWEQLLGEINRGDWAVCLGSARDAVHPQPKRLWEEIWSRPEVTLPMKSSLSLQSLLEANTA